MKTRSRDGNTTPGLPPPPAPTSRDANPWSMEEQQAPAMKGHATAIKGQAPALKDPVPAAAPSRRPQRFPARASGTVEPRRRPIVPLLILAFVAMTAIGLVAEALQSGTIEDAIGPLVAVAFVAFMIWRQLRGRRS